MPIEPAHLEDESPDYALSFLSETSLDRHVMDELTLIISQQIGLYSTAQRVNTAESLGLSLQDYSALELIIGFQSLTTGQLTRLTGLSSGGATSLLNRLEESGYVHRERHPLDRRVITVRPVIEQCRPVLERAQEKVREALSVAICQHSLHIRPAYDLLKHCLNSLHTQTREYLDIEPEIRVHTPSV